MSSIPITLAGSTLPTDQIAQEWQATFSYDSGVAGGFWGGNYIFYNNTLYAFGEKDSLKALSFDPNTDGNSIPPQRHLPFSQSRIPLAMTHRWEFQ